MLIPSEQIKPDFNTHQPISVTFQNPSKPQCEQMPQSHNPGKAEQVQLLARPLAESHHSITPCSAFIAYTLCSRVHGSHRDSTPSLPIGPSRTFIHLRFQWPVLVATHTADHWGDSASWERAQVHIPSLPPKTETLFCSQAIEAG